MTTPTETDANWVLGQISHRGQCSHEDSARIRRLLSRGSEPPADPDLITDPCRCNQPDANRDRRHQRGDLAVCRDAIDALAVPKETTR